MKGFLSCKNGNTVDSRFSEESCFSNARQVNCFIRQMLLENTKFKWEFLNDFQLHFITVIEKSWFYGSCQVLPDDQKLH